MERDITFLVKKSKQGDSHAFAALYDFYKEDMYRFALYMMKEKSDAEDAVQEAVFSAWQNIGRLKNDDAFKAWLFKILSNKCKTMLVSSGKNGDTLDFDGAEYLVSRDEDDCGSLSLELKEALAALTPPDGQIVLLSVIGGFKSDELSVIFGMPPSTVRSKRKRALEKLRKFLS